MSFAPGHNRDSVHFAVLIYLCLAHMSESGLEQKYVKEAFDTNWVVPLGPNVNAFEEDLKQFTGDTHEVVALSAGTAAVHLALIVCGVGPGEMCIRDRLYIIHKVSCYGKFQTLLS